MTRAQSARNVVATGVVGLDTILGGGLPANRLYLVQGDPGVGKTTLALQFLLEGRRIGEKGMYVTLGESREELEAVAASHGWDLKGIHIVEISTGESEEDVREDESYDVFHPSEVELGEVMQSLRAEAERARPARVIIDSLSEVRLLAREPLRYRRQLLGIKRFFIKTGGTILLLDAAEESKIGDLQSNTLVHGVIRMDQATPAFGLKRRRLSVVKLRGVSFDDGFHDFKVQTGGLRVYPRLVAADHGTAVPTGAVSSGLQGLDALMGGGMAWGSSTLILGAAGVGKSTLASAYATTAAQRGECTAIFTFDESVGTFIARADGLGMNMSDAVKSGRIKIVRVDPGDLAPGEFAHLVRKAVEEDGAKLVVIDSLNGYLNATPDERFLIVQMHELLTYLSNKGVATLLVVAQYGLLGSGIESSVDASYLADGVVMLRYFEHGGEVRKAISVLKKRTGTHELTIREFKITPKGIEIGDPLHEFQGVLSGVPTYRGKTGNLIGEGDGSRDE